jgi:DNA-binding ferritin-like protein
MMVKFAGIKSPYEEGKYGVEENSKVMQRYRFIHESLMRIGAGHLPVREDWDLKVALGKHTYEDAEAANSFRNRITQLRTSAARLHQEPDPALSLLMDELLHANNDLELLLGIYDVVKPALLETYKKHMKETQQIVDQPTIRILRSVIADLEDQIEWGKEMIQDVKAEGIYPEGAKDFRTKMESFLSAAGGVDGKETKSTALPMRWRSHEPFVLPLKSVRDPRKMGPVTHARTSVANPPEDPNEQRLAGMMRVRQEEMTAAELIAGVLYSQKNMPWDFYRELARHLWDEVRHSMFGQAALEAEGYDWMSRPQYTSDYDVNAPKIPSAQYTWLAIGIEEGAMKRPGKRGEYEFCLNEAKHPLMTQFQDYDWADEVVHATFGRKWSPELIGEDIEFAREVAQKELDHFWKEVGAAQQKWENSNRK